MTQEEFEDLKILSGKGCGPISRGCADCMWEEDGMEIAACKLMSINGVRATVRATAKVKLKEYVGGMI